MICQENMVCVHFYTFFFLSWLHSSGSQSSIIGDRQSIVYLSRTLPLTPIYISSLYYGGDRIICFLLPSKPFCYLLPSTWCNIPEWWALCGRKRNYLRFFPPSPRDVQKGTKTDISFSLMSGPVGGNSPLCVRCCWEMSRESETAKSKIIPPTLKSPVQKPEASFCHENHFCLKHQPEIIAYLLGIDSWVFFLNFALFWQ